MLNTETNQWEKSAGIGELPAPRASHCAAVTSKKRLMFFGGRKASVGEEGVSSLSNDGYFLNPDNAKWVKLEVVGEVMPEPVEKAQMCPFGESTLLLGGDTTPAHQVSRWGIWLELVCERSNQAVNGDGGRPALCSLFTLELSLFRLGWSL